MLNLQSLAFHVRTCFLSDNWLLLLLLIRIDDVEFYDEDAVVQGAAIVVLLRSLRVLRFLVLHGGRAQELPEIVPIKTANLQWSMFLKQFLFIKKRTMSQFVNLVILAVVSIHRLQMMNITYLKIAICDLILKNIPHLQTSVRMLVRLDLLSL